MYNLYIHNDAADDIEHLLLADPEAAAKIVALLEELHGNQDLLDRLTQHEFGKYTKTNFSVSRIVSQWKIGRNLWRLKIRELEEIRLRYRIIYAFVPVKKNYHILAIAPRDNYNYEPNHELTQRITKAHDTL